MRQRTGKTSAKRLEQRRVWREKHPENSLLTSAKSRAKEFNLPFDIVVKDIIIPEFCPILGIKLERGKEKCQDSSPSLDRIRPELGYIRGNVWVISFKANTIKNNATLEELELVVSSMRRVCG